MQLIQCRLLKGKMLLQFYIVKENKLNHCKIKKMKKIQFTLQIVVLILAFPVWFIAEINRVDKLPQKNSSNNAGSVTIKKTAVKLKVLKNGQPVTATIPGYMYLLVNN
jgi:hypothetical protein